MGLALLWGWKWATAGFRVHRKDAPGVVLRSEQDVVLVDIKMRIRAARLN